MKLKIFLFIAIFCSVLGTYSCSENSVAPIYSGNTDFISFKYTVGEPGSGAPNLWEFYDYNYKASVVLSVPEITQYVMDYGSVQIQIYNPSEGQWYTVPYSSRIDPSSGYQEIYGTSYGFGQVIVDLEAINAFDPLNPYQISQQPVTKIKVVILQDI